MSQWTSSLEECLEHLRDNDDPTTRVTLLVASNEHAIALAIEETPGLCMTLTSLVQASPQRLDEQQVQLFDRRAIEALADACERMLASDIDNTSCNLA